MRPLLLTTGIILLFLSEILRIFFILPFAFSQKFHAIDAAYFFYHHAALLRVIALFLIAYPALYIFRYATNRIKIFLCAVMALYGYVFFYSNAYLEASEKYQPLTSKTFALKKQNKISTDKQVIGVSINGEQKAFPIQLISYHHCISDTIGGMPVIITYCSLCRSARVFSAGINGKASGFKLIGVNQFNAIIEDSITKSWWQQETGKAIAGPMKGKHLEELSSNQVSLSSWLHQYPASEILQPSVLYAGIYAQLDGYEKGGYKENMLQVDSATYAKKSLVVGVVNKNKARAYDWNKLSFAKVVQDSFAGTPLLITVDDDNTSFHVLDRNINDTTLQFTKTKSPDEIKDINTSSLWNMDGKCIEGNLAGTQLQEVQSYQETRESWDNFHKESEEYDGEPVPAQ